MLGVRALRTGCRRSWGDLGAGGGLAGSDALLGGVLAHQINGNKIIAKGYYFYHEMHSAIPNQATRRFHPYKNWLQKQGYNNIRNQNLPRIFNNKKDIRKVLKFKMQPSSITHQSYKTQPSSIKAPFFEESELPSLEINFSSCSEDKQETITIKNLNSPVDQEIQEEYSCTPRNQSNQHTAPSRKSQRKTLTQQMIYQLNETFQDYTKREENNCKQGPNLKDIAKSFDLAYSTLRKKYQEFKKNSYVPEGKRLKKLPQSYSKNRLARSLILRSFQQGMHFHKARELSQYLEQKYGICYSIKLLNRQLRKMGVRIQDNPSANQIAYDPFTQQQQAVQFLLQGLIKMERNMLYLGKYRFKYTEDEEITIVLLASRSCLAVKVMCDAEMDFATFLKEMIYEYSSQFLLDFSELWYLVVGYEDIVQTQSDTLLMRKQENNFYTEMGALNPKIIFLTSATRTLNPVYQIYEQITYKICMSKLDASSAVKILPHWLAHQQSTVLRIISKAELDLVTAAHLLDIQ